MAGDTFEGRAQLDIAPFLAALTDMEQKATASAASIKAQFTGLAADFRASFAGLSTGAQPIQQAAAQVTAQAQVIRRGAQDQVKALQQLSAYEKVIRQQAAKEAVRQEREKANELLTNLKYSVGRQVDAQAWAAKRRVEIIRESIVNEAKAETAARISAASSLRAADSAQRSTGDGDAVRARAAREIQAAEEALQKRTVLERRLTEAVRAEDAVRTRINTDGARRNQAAAIAANRAISLSGKDGLDAFARAFEETIRRVEDRWNSVFRAGTQIEAVGAGFLTFAKQVGTVGTTLTESAGDFDFWIARTKAAMQAAGSTEAAIGITELRDRTLDLGKSLGSLDPAQLAQGWFTYQAALGETIETSQDLTTTQDALRTMLQAGIISDSSPETVMRGVAGVLAAYRLETEDSAYATQVLMNVTQRTQAEFSDLLESYKMIGSQAPVMNANLAETSALLSAMAQQNIKGSQAGRALNMVYSRLNDMTKEGAVELNKVMVQSQGLQGTWEDIAFAGGPFIGLLGEIDAQGNSVKEGFIEKFVQPFMDLPKEIRDVELSQAIGKIFPENAARGFIPLILAYADGLDAVKAGGAGAKNELLTLFAEFQDGGKQADLFAQQWKTVSNSLRQQFDRATYGFREGLIRIGVIAAEVFIPAVEVVGRLVSGFADFAEANPAVAKSIMGIVGALALIAAIVGPALIGIGLILQGVSGFAVASTAIAGMKGVLLGLASTLTGAAAPSLVAFLPLAAAAAVLFLLWQTNIGGVRDAMGGLTLAMGGLTGGLGELLGGLVEVIEGGLSGSEEKLREGSERMVKGALEVLVLFPERVGQVLSSWQQAFFDWGFNLIISLQEGIYAAAQYVFQAASDIAEGIASYFRSYSPPKFGPLRGIYTWGRNLIRTFIDGMAAADITAVSDIASRIGDALKLSSDTGAAEGGLDLLGLSLVGNELAAEMVGILQDGGRVSGDFFDGLAAGMGEWYADIKNILFAYQEVYLAEKGLTVEQKKLDLIKKQREELEKQYKLKEDAFTAEVEGSNEFNLADNKAAMVDPTTDNGKSKIAEMRAALSTEDFQAWISFQQELWSKQKEAEDKALGAQQEAADVAVAALTQQLELVKAQYDYYVKIYEYAKSLMEANKPEAASGGGGGGGANPKEDNLGDPAALEEARKRIRELVGSDQAISDEVALAQQLGGDLPALGGADGQKDREQDRVGKLDGENRRRRAKFETDLINAKSDEEKTALRKTMDAWDAAYKEEKARLQDRLGLTKDITEAADQQAELSSSERIQAARAVAEQTINEEMGGQLQTAGALKGEETELQGLRNIGDRKRLDFEKRLREAKGDEETTRRIKEEQQAWEEAYKAAVQLQEERVEALRKLEQENKEKAKAAGKGAGGGGGGPGIPDVGDYDDYVPDPSLVPGGRRTPGQYSSPIGPPTAEQAGKQARIDAIFADLMRGIDFLGDKSIPAKTKVEALGNAIAEALGYSNSEGKFDWTKMLGLNALENAAVDLGGKVRAVGKGITDTLASWEKPMQAWAKSADQAVADWYTNFDTGWKTYVIFPALSLASGFWTALAAGWTQYVLPVTPNLWAGFWSALGLGWATTILPATPGLWTNFWANLAAGWATVVVTPTPELWSTFWTALGQGWVLNVLPTTPDLWTSFWSALGLGWVLNVLPGTPNLWADFWTNLKKGWDMFVAEPGKTLTKAFEPIGAAISSFQRKVDGFISWLQGLGVGGGKGTEKKGGSADGSFKTGLASVPYDGFVAELHAAERVLTAEEATAYNGLERSGLLGGMPRLVDAVSAVVATTQSLLGNVLAAANNASSSAVSTVSNTSNRSTSLSIGRLDASDPSAGRAFLEQIAFHGA